MRNTVPTRTYYTYITSSHLGVGAGRGLCSPNRYTSPPDQPIVRYGNHTHMTYQRKAQSDTNQKDVFSFVVRLQCIHYNTRTSTISIGWTSTSSVVRLCNNTCHRLRSSSYYCVQVPSTRSKKILDDQSFTKYVTTLWKNLQDDLRSYQSLTFIRQPSCEIIWHFYTVYLFAISPPGSFATNIFILSVKTEVDNKDQ